MDNILIVDDNASLLYALSNILEDAGYIPRTAKNGSNAIEEITESDFSLVILDYKLPDADGIQILNQIKSKKPHLPVIILTAHGDIKNAVESIKKGAEDYITKPFNNDEILITIKRILKEKRIRDELNLLQQKFNKSYYDTEIIIASPVMKEIIGQVERVAPTNMTVLLQGESGSGKEVIANTIHKMSSRSNGPFVAVDCGAIPDSLFESELFGYEKGAFTDAKASKEGKFEIADKGTLFLDEILNLSDSNQIKLLRVIEERRLTRLGGGKLIEIDVRIITASNTNLMDAVNKGKFRADLFYRLNEFQITIPPLRERKDDIPDLLNQFIKDANKELDKNVERVEESVLRNIYSYNWPGNIRELRNAVRRAVLLSDDKVIKSMDFPENYQTADTEAAVTDNSKDLSFHSSAKNAEREIIIDALKQNNGNKTFAAKMLKMNLRTLYRKIKLLNITKKDFT